MFGSGMILLNYVHAFRTVGIKYVQIGGGNKCDRPSAHCMMYVCCISGVGVAIDLIFLNAPKRV